MAGGFSNGFSNGFDIDAGVTATPDTVFLSLDSFAPTASTGQTFTPDTTVLGITGLIPTVTTGTGTTVTPPTTSLGITTFAPLPPTQEMMLQELWALTQRLKLDVDLLFALLR